MASDLNLKLFFNEIFCLLRRKKIKNYPNISILFYYTSKLKIYICIGDFNNFSCDCLIYFKSIFMEYI